MPTRAITKPTASTVYYKHILGLLLGLVVVSLVTAEDWIHEGLPHLDATTPVHVTTGQQLARAIADGVSGAGPRVIQLDAAQVTLTKADWEGIPLPLVLPPGANLTIRGSSNLTAGPTLLELSATPAAVSLQHNSTFVIEDMVVQNYANGTLLRGTNLNYLARSPDGTRSALAVARRVASIIPICLPAGAFEQSLVGLPRPADVPGRQVVSTGALSQEGCSNDTSAPPLRRCWAAVYGVEDVVQAGAELDAASNPNPTHYSVALQQCRFLCTRVLDRACVESLGPLGCMLVTLRGKDGGTVLRGPPSSPVIAALPTGSPHLAAEGGSSGPPLAAILAGSIVGGVALIALVAAATLVVVTRWRLRQRDAGLEERKGEELPGQRMQTCSSDGLAGSTLDTLHKDACGAQPQASQAPSASVATPTDCGSCSTATPSEQRVASSGPAPHLQGPHPAPQQQESVEPPPAAPYPRGAPKNPDVISRQTPLQEVPVDVKVVELEGQGSTVPTSLDTDTSLASSGCTLRDRVLPAPAALPATDNVVRLTGVVLGKGAYGCVYEGTFRGRLVAVKKLFEAAGDLSALTSCTQELQVLGRCDHPNIVKVLAACVVDTARPTLVLMRMDTSLDKMLYGSPGTLLPLRLVLHIAIQIAQGLSYLHPTILHRDLKPANVLISDPHGEAPLVKLSDFGLSRLRESVLVTVQPDAGTPPYTAPECFDLTSASISHRADCYSFGVLLWEMLAGVRPWGGLNAVQIAYNVTLMSYRLPVPAHDTPGRDVSRWPPRLRRLLWQCWEADPRRRPAAAEIVKALTLAQEELKRDAHSP